MRTLAKRSILVVAIAAFLPSTSLLAQATPAPVGVVRQSSVNAGAPRPTDSTALAPEGASTAQHVLLGGVIGAVVGVAMTALMVQDCKASNGHHDGPPCEIAYVIVGVPMAAGGAGLGALIGYFWANRPSETQ